ncbi:MAG: cell division protein FtsZ, partial [Nostocales cyanobacterium]
MTLDNYQELIYQNTQSVGQQGLSVAVNSHNPFSSSSLNFGQNHDKKMPEPSLIGEIVPGRVA